MLIILQILFPLSIIYHNFFSIASEFFSIYTPNHLNPPIHSLYNIKKKKKKKKTVEKEPITVNKLKQKKRKRKKKEINAENF